MEVILLIVGVLIAAALAYVGFQIKNANKIAAVQVEFQKWNAAWTDERRRQFDAHISAALDRH